MNLNSIIHNNISKIWYGTTVFVKTNFLIGIQQVFDKYIFINNMFTILKLLECFKKKAFLLLIKSVGHNIPTIP